MGNKCAQVVKFLDVGHGDSSVVFLNNHADIYTVIIDIPKSDKLLKELRDKNVRVVDLLVISHSDSDHCKGVNDFLEKYASEGSVVKVCFNLDRHKPTLTMKLFLKKFMEYYKKYKMQLVSGTNDTTVSSKKIVELNDTNFSVIYPNEKDSINAYLTNNVNNMSIVCSLSNSDYNILFTGDLGPEGWQSIFERNPELTCDVLKMPHHGAYYDDLKNEWGTKKILEQLKPKIAIISTGENAKYNHPSSETIKALRDNGVDIYCTEYTSLCNNITECGEACNGDISVIRNGKSYDVETQSSNKNILDNSACMPN